MDNNLIEQSNDQYYRCGGCLDNTFNCIDTNCARPKIFFVNLMDKFSPSVSIGRLITTRILSASSSQHRNELSKPHRQE